MPFLLVSLLFLLWGLANNMTDTLLSAFKRVMAMSDTQTALIQFAFYGSYFCFAIPAALFIRRFSYKAGILFGLALYALGAMLFYPSALAESYAFYLVAIYILAGGCSFLETVANPYILAMGTPETATRRLNIAQSLNPLGSITGILLSQAFILSNISLMSISGTYVGLGVVLVVIMIAMAFCLKPLKTSVVNTAEVSAGPSAPARKTNLGSGRYLFGVLAQFFYIGAQIGVWSYTIRLVMLHNSVNESSAATIYLLTIVAFSLMRFVFTWLMKYFAPTTLLAIAAMIAIVATAFVINGTAVIPALIVISGCMSLMFPTIYGEALSQVDEQSKKMGASGLIMAILGGAVLTPVQGVVSDTWGVYTSYAVPLGCFVIVLIYSLYLRKQ